MRKKIVYIGIPVTEEDKLSGIAQNNYERLVRLVENHKEYIVAKCNVHCIKDRLSCILGSDAVIFPITKKDDKLLTLEMSIAKNIKLDFISKIEFMPVKRENTVIEN